MQLVLPLYLVPAELDRLYSELHKLQRGQMARATEIGYAHDLKMFRAFCQKMGLADLPASPQTLALFIADQLSKGKKVATVCRQAAGVAHAHRRQGFESPLTRAVRDTLWGARRLKHEPLRQMAPLTVEQVRRIAAGLAADPGPLAARNRAIVLFGFASALRRSNLSALRLEDLRFCGEGLVVRVTREKQDQAGRGRQIAIPLGKDEATCPVRSLQAWLRHRGYDGGPLFTRLDPARKSSLEGLSRNGIWTVVKAACASIGLNGLYGPHSLRAGLISAAGQGGVSPLVIARQSGHRSLDSVQRYFRPVDLFTVNAAGLIGL